MTNVSIPSNRVVGFNSGQSKQFKRLVEVSIPSNRVVGFNSLQETVAGNRSEVSIPSNRVVGFNLSILERLLPASGNTFQSPQIGSSVLTATTFLLSRSWAFGPSRADRAPVMDHHLLSRRQRRQNTMEINVRRSPRGITRRFRPPVKYLCAVPRAGAQEGRRSARNAG